MSPRVAVRQWTLGLLIALACGVAAAAETPLDQRVQADRAYRQGNFVRAAELYRSLALHHRDPDSEFMWGRMCIEGLATSLSAEAARQWIERAADQGSLAALHWLAQQAPGDRHRAVWLRRAAELGDTRAMAALLDARDGLGRVGKAVLRDWAARVAEVGEPAGRLIAIRSLRDLAPQDYDRRRLALQGLLNTVRLPREVRAQAAALMAAEMSGADQSPQLQYFWARVAEQGGQQTPLDADSIRLGLARPVGVALDEGAVAYWRRHPDAEIQPTRIVDQLTARSLPVCAAARELADAVLAAFSDGANAQQAHDAVLATVDDRDLSRRQVQMHRVRVAVADFFAAEGLSPDARHALIAGRCR